MGKFRLLTLIIGGISFILVGCQQTTSNDNSTSINILDIPKETPNEEEVVTFDIIAQSTVWEIKGTRFEAWTYNNEIPGEEIRVTEGDFIRVNLKNNLDEPVTIHWHGMVLPNMMDGVAGVTQNAVQPDEEYTYEFEAIEAGTYWYHSHQDSGNQVDRGLYGALIVEPMEKSYDQDVVLMVDEWSIGESGGMMDHMSGGTPGEMDSQMTYGTFTVNGKSAPNIDPIVANFGERVRLRLVNAGYQKHYFYLQGNSYNLVANDGKEVIGAPLTSDVIEIAPGERLDIEFNANQSNNWYISSVNNVEGANDIRIPIIVNHVEKQVEDIDPVVEGKKELSLIDFTNIGEMESIISSEAEPDLIYEMDLNVGMGMMAGGMTYKINGKTFPNTDPIKVQKGDVVKVTIINNSMLDHPMHLHGHYFQVITRNGERLKNPLVKDLINVKPHEQYEILFTADNPGEWVFHCHDLVHAGNGMVTVVKYNGYYSPFELEGEYFNKPE
ncbi:multicopper oxidase family protein [Bacillus sp. SM2101]|uniref:multicopper oxidase family protein n=1 Tax=Bacillus sp. SM2101 TaxID=2805366 RepID=UPI001BDE8241|nr:multicopper oxidase family protein [Bacillus sp. SM2101]